MARYEIPQNVGKVTVAVAGGGVYAVWNRKQGKHEFRILVKTKKQAQEICDIINKKQHPGWIEVLA
jgi:hypothetical protein